MKSERPQQKLESFEDLFTGQTEEEVFTYADKVKKYLAGAHITYDADGKIDEVVLPRIPQAEAEMAVANLEYFLQTVWVDEIIRKGEKMVEISLTNPKDMRRLDFLALLESGPIAPDMPKTESEHTPDETEALPADEHRDAIPTGYEFPVPKTQEKTPRPRQQQNFLRHPNVSTTEAEPVDDFMQRQTEEFAAGATDHETTGLEKKNPFTGRKLKNGFYWQEGQLFGEDGKPIDDNEYEEILIEAKTNEKVRDQVMAMNEGLIHYVYRNLSKKFTPNHRIDADDLLQAGRMGMMRAIIKHEPYREGRQTFFIKYIEGYMRRELVERRAVRLPVNLSEFAAKFYDAIRELESEHGPILELGGSITPELIAQKTGMPLERVREMAQLVFRQTDEEYDEEKAAQYDEADIGPERLHEEANQPLDNLIAKQLREKTAEVLNTLPPREELVLRLRFVITNDSEHWRSGSRAQEINSRAKTQFNENIERLMNLNVHNLAIFKELTPAERVLCVLLGKLSERAIADLQSPDSETNSPCTLDDIGNIFGVNRGVIGDIQYRGLRMIKHPTRSRTMRSFLDT